MMDKKVFVEKMNVIEKMWGELREKEVAFGSMFNTSNVEIPLNRDLFYLIISTMETAVIGRDLENLAWIFFEYDGELSNSCFINDEDGSIIELKNWEDVYDFLIEENENPIYKGEYKPEVIKDYGLDTLNKLIG